MYGKHFSSILLSLISYFGLDDSRKRPHIMHTFKSDANSPDQEPITRSVQLPHIPVTAFSQTDLFLYWSFRN